MRKIKFRARGLTGETYFGDYVTRQDGAAIRVRENTSLFNLHEFEIAVEPDSVAQLIACDKNGNEIYEGDYIKSHFGSSCLASFVHYDGILSGRFVLSS